jgi:hypothetical protein
MIRREPFWFLITDNWPLALVGPGRLELPTSRLSGVRSNHLSYGPPGWVPSLRRQVAEDGADAKPAGLTPGTSLGT